MVAIPPSSSYFDWSPINEKKIDARLIVHSDSYQNRLIPYLANNRLKELYTHQSKLDSESFSTLNEQSPDIQVLNLFGAQKIDKKALMLIADFTELNELNLNQVSFYPCLDERLRIETSLCDRQVSNQTKKELISYLRKRMQWIKDDDVERILTKCTKLQALAISNSMITDASLAKATEHGALRRLQIGNCPYITRKGIQYLHFERPDIEVEVKDLNFEIEAYLKLEEATRNRFLNRISNEIEFDPSVTETDRLLLNTTALGNC